MSLNKLKSWIDIKYIEDKRGLAYNPCTSALKIIVDKSKTVKKDIEWYSMYRDSLLSNSNPDFVKRVLKPYLLCPSKELAYNQSPEIVDWCINILTDYELECKRRGLDNFIQDNNKMEFLKALNINQFATEPLVEYIMSHQDSQLVSNRLIDIQSIVKTYSIHYGTLTGLKDKTRRYIISCLSNQTIDINSVTKISDECVVDIILQNIPKIDFSGDICYNTNSRLTQILSKNIDRLCMHKLCCNPSDFALILISQNLHKVSYQSWVYAMNFNDNPQIVQVLSPLNYKITDTCLGYHRLLQRCGRFDPVNFRWDQCTDLKLIEENLPYIRDKSTLPWDILSSNPDIFENVENVEKEVYDIALHYHRCIQILNTKSMFVFPNKW